MTSRSAVGAALLFEKIARDTYLDRSPSATTPMQWSTLRLLDRFHPEGNTLIQIAKYLGVTRAPASRCVASLLKKGYVERVPNPDDGRSAVVTLTDLGRAQLRYDPISRLANALSVLERQDRTVFERSLVRIAESVLTKGAG